MVSKRWIERIDPELPGAKKAEKLQELLTAYWVAQPEDGPELPMSRDDIQLLRNYAADKNYKVRSVAVDFLTEYGPCSWEDLEKWSLDTSSEVRWHAISAVEDETNAAGKLCWDDKERCVNMLTTAARRRVEYAAGNAMHSLSYEFDNPLSEDSRIRRYRQEWLGLTWRAAEELIDLRRPNLTEMLVCCYFEHVIPDNNWGPGDKHIAPWIEGTDPQRKVLLLAIALWWGLDAGRMLEIVQRLSLDADSAVARLATDILQGQKPPIEFSRDYYKMMGIALVSE